MNRRAALQLLTGTICSASLPGCLTDGQWSVAGMFGLSSSQTPKVPRGHAQVAERVETLGRKIISQNTFTGLDPIFQTMGIPEQALFHSGTAIVYVSDGLVKRCKTEPELAAVLCSELGQMMAEKQAAGEMGKDKDSIPATTSPGSELGSTGPKAAELGHLERRRPVGQKNETADAAQLARQLLSGAGFDPAVLAKVEPLLKQSNRGEALQKQMAGSAPAPTWTE